MGDVNITASKINRGADHRAVEEAARRRVEMEEIRRMEMILYQKDPMSWLKDRFKEDPLNYQWSARPGYKNHKWDATKDPMYKMWMDLANGNWTGVEAATGTSKTFSLSRIVFWFLDVFPDSLVVTSAPKQAQLTLHLWSEIGKAFYKFRKLRNRAKLYNLRLVVEEREDDGDFDEDNPNLSKSWQAVGFVAGVGSEEASATKAQGFHRQHMLIITEETPGMPHAVMTAFKNTSTGDHNLICSVGNPDSQLDPLHQFCTLPNVKHRIASALDYPNVVEDNEIIKGAVTRASIMRRLIEYGEKSAMYQSRVRGLSPSQGVDSLIQLSWLEQCRDRKLPYDGTYHAVGVDAANSKDGDKAALAWGRGNHLVELQDFYCDNATHLAYNLYMLAGDLANNKYADYNTSKLDTYEVMSGLIGVDTVGIGIATFNALLDAGYEPVSLQGGQWDDCIPDEEYTDPTDGKEKERKMYKFSGLRSQMYWEFREDVRNGRIWFAIEDKDLLQQLFIELISIKVTYKDNYVVVEPKDNIKKRLGGKSPNKADAVVYWNWTRKGYRLGSGEMPILGF